MCIRDSIYSVRINNDNQFNDFICPNRLTKIHFLVDRLLIVNRINTSSSKHTNNMCNNYIIMKKYYFSYTHGPTILCNYSLYRKHYDLIRGWAVFLVIIICIGWCSNWNACKKGFIFLREYKSNFIFIFSLTSSSCTMTTSTPTQLIFTRLCVCVRALTRQREREIESCLLYTSRCV